MSVRRDNSFRCSQLRNVVAVYGSSIDGIAKAFLSQVPEKCSQRRQERDGESYHITVLSPDEVKQINAGEVEKHFGQVSQDDIIALGVGKVGNVWFCVIESPVLQRGRKALGLASKDFHITLGFEDGDSHTIRKDARTLVCPSDVDRSNVAKILESYLAVGEVHDNLPLFAVVDQWASDAQVSMWSQLVRAKAAGRRESFEEMLPLCNDHVHDKDAGFYASYLMGFAFMKLQRFTEAAGMLDKALETRTASAPADLVKKVEDVARVCHEKAEGASTGALMFKFPRTHHIFDAGGSGVTRDDLVMDVKDAKSYLQKRIFVEEKIDGANLGIWLDTDYTIRCQNRSHIVTHESATQWKGLNTWMDEHAATLCQLLEPRKHILFGEWMYAKHSLVYDRLPAFFVAFDLYDVKRKKFYSRTRLYNLLADTDIHVVPLLHAGPVASLDEFRARLDTPSMFKTDGSPVEGVYIREDDAAGEWLVRRCKLVRSDFVQGIKEHWASMELVKNTVDYEFAIDYREQTRARRDELSLHQAANEHATNEQAGEPQQHSAGGTSQSPVGGTEVEQARAGEDKAGVIPVGEYCEPRSTTLGVNGVKLPRNFSFVVDWLALSSIPKSKEQCAGMDVDLIISLTDEEALPTAWFPLQFQRPTAQPGEPPRVCTNLYMPVPNYHPPSMHDMRKICTSVETKRKETPGLCRVMVHCGGGKGRAGTVAACLLLRDCILHGHWHAARGGAGPDFQLDTGAGVIAFLRHLRPGCIETERQEAIVREFADSVWEEAAGACDEASALEANLNLSGAAGASASESRPASTRVSSSGSASATPAPGSGHHASAASPGLSAASSARAATGDHAGASRGGCARAGQGKDARGWKDAQGQGKARDATTGTVNVKLRTRVLMLCGLSGMQLQFEEECRPAPLEVSSHTVGQHAKS
eukprot:CAMPEP_0181295212 /NCGR_PEP_ID=MMETSP1101-20121128/4022_1 /TAXON_ID=46948 /ORGANISM="Rhodomonas abbreviata, Strain Caron Lab Isolate" /LENGTH=926 /DNA_ID=CAMNT_0023399939 /DNA_START=126 /DNA_END=2906 /DNA_ORIENTATION=+